MSDYLIELNGVSQKYPDNHGNERTILNGVNLRIRPGDFVTIVGPTGCGKSTLLRMILGAEPPFSGTALIHGQPIGEPDRDRGIVFQQYSLFEHLTVLQNVVFGLELETFDLLSALFRPFFFWKHEKSFRARAMGYLEDMGLDEHADKYPCQLSGGMRQRVAIAQAMIMCPEVLLMDEPFGALDAGTREEMQIFTLEQWRQEHTTVIFVTHDLEEAIFMGTRVIVLSYHYSNNDGSKAIGSKIVTDIPIPWPHPRPMDIKHTPEFNELMGGIRRDGLDPEFLQTIDEFDLRHQDAIKDFPSQK